MDRFEIDVNNLKIAGSEQDVSKTIEELLGLNNLIPERWNEPADGITQKQMVESDRYEGKKSRGEQAVVTEIQFGHEGEPDYQVVEIEANKAAPENAGHNSKTWETNDEKIRGHKDIPPLWQRVYEQEDKRK